MLPTSPVSPTSKSDISFSNNETSVLWLVCSLLYNILENASRQKADDFRTHYFCFHRDHSLAPPIVHYLKRVLLYIFLNFHLFLLIFVFSCFGQKGKSSPMNFLFFVFCLFKLVSYFIFSCQLHLKFILLC